MKTKLIASIALLSAFNAFAQKQQPNIIMIAVDDLNDWVGVYGGNPQVKTPNIDKLAQSSVVFRNASCPGPVCGPSRSALLSGFRPSTTGAYSNFTNMIHSEVVQTNATLPEYFTKNGYLTISSGKIFHKHSTENGEDHGHWAYDIWEKETGSEKPQPDKFYSRAKGIINGKKIDSALYSKVGGPDFAFGPCIEKIEATKDYRTAKWFEKKLQENYDKPFFMSFGLSKPHLSFVVPEEFFNLYDLNTIKVPDYRMDDLDDILDKNGNKVYKAEDDFLWAEHYGIHKDVVRAYMAAISYADACVGVVLDALENSKYADNTIVILWGDHGWHLCEKLRYRKGTLWRESTQLPFIFHTPGMSKMQNCNRNVNLLDIYPSLIDLCKLPKKELDGKSFAPLLTNPTLPWTPTLTTSGKGQHSVISEKWHYIKGRGGVEELYNLEADPMEFVNLINKSTAETQSVIKELRSYLPKNEVPEITRKYRDKSSKGGDGDGDDNSKDPDPTIKPTRVLSELK